jgi:Zn finger protein HypA/HybF involved in hydrogenase expression
MLMHETMIAQSLFAAISDEAAKYNAKPVAARISCGMLSAVNDEILCFAFEAIAAETPC